MRKRLMNISKRCMVAIMSASFIMSSVTVSMAFPVGVYAEEYTSNQIHKDPIEHSWTFIEYGESLKEVIQDYPVSSNNGFIEVNNGTVESNNEEINTNNNRVESNGATIVNNYAIVHQSGGTITNQYAGTVDGNGAITNFFNGTVDGNGTITNFFNGTIADESNIDVTNNYSDQDIATATNNYSAVNFLAPEGGTVAYSGSFTTAKPDGVTDVHYVNVTNDNGSGTITIKPDESGYEVTREAGDVENATMTGEEDSYTFNYSLTKSGNNYILNISNYSGKSCELDAEMFALVIQTIKLPLRPTGAVVQNEDGSVSVGYTDADTAASVSAPATIDNSDSVTAFYIVKGFIDNKAKLGWEIQGKACMAAFNVALPAGYKIFNTLSMSYDGKNSYDRKLGSLLIYIPPYMQKTGREFAIMCINKDGEVFVYNNTSESAGTFTADIDFEGYAMCLIYKD